MLREKVPGSISTAAQCVPVQHILLHIDNNEDDEIEWYHKDNKDNEEYKDKKDENESMDNKR